MFAKSEAEKMALQSRFSQLSNEEIERRLENSVPAKDKERNKF